MAVLPTTSVSSSTGCTSVGFAWQGQRALGDIGNLGRGKTNLIGIDARTRRDRSARPDAYFTTAACVDRQPRRLRRTCRRPGNRDRHCARLVAVQRQRRRDRTAVYQGGTRVSYVTSPRRPDGTLVRQGLQPRRRTVDGAGNRSPVANVVASTASCDSPPPPPTGDRTVPTAPQNLGIGSASQTQLLVAGTRPPTTSGSSSTASTETASRSAKAPASTEASRTSGTTADSRAARRTSTESRHSTLLGTSARRHRRLHRRRPAPRPTRHRRRCRRT